MFKIPVGGLFGRLPADGIAADAKVFGKGEK
jgi:hypothetical protein